MRVNKLFAKNPFAILCLAVLVVASTCGTCRGEDDEEEDDDDHHPENPCEGGVDCGPVE